MIKRLLLVVCGLAFTSLPSLSHAMPPGCYAEAVNQNSLREQFDDDPDAKLTVALQAAEAFQQFVDENGRIKADLPADARAALAQLGYKAGDLIAGATPIERMKTIAGKISALGGALNPTQLTALKEQVASALFGRDVSLILDVAGQGAAAFDQILQFANLDALALAQLQTFIDVPMAQVNAIISGIQGIPNQLQAFITGTATKQVQDAMAALGIDLATAQRLYALKDVNPQAILQEVTARMQAQIAAVGEAGLNRLQEMVAPLVGGQAIAAALTDLAARGPAFLQNLLANLPLDLNSLVGALTNILGNMFNLNWLFGGSALTEDYGYRNEELMGLENVWGPQPSEPMPHKRTANVSPQVDFSPWYLTNLQMPKTADPKARVSPELEAMVGKYAPYVGAAYRGENDVLLFRQRINQAGEGTSIVTCERNIKPVGADPDPYDPAWARLEIDNCANQYILNHARFPMVVHEEAGAYRYINETACQTMRLMPLTAEEKEDYDPSRYLAEAWKRLFIDAKHRMADRPGPSPAEPDYASVGTHEHKGKFNLEISKAMAIPDCTETDPEAAVEKCFGKIKINELIEKVPERIYDPSHPFSPRWDFEMSEREKYSPKTVLYDQLGAAGLYSVRCAGSAVPWRAPGSIPVDIMNFRLEKKFNGSNFHYWTHRRIKGNIAAMTVLYIYDGSNLETWWDYFNCSADEPCCSTAYDVDDTLPEPFRTMLCGQPTYEDMCTYMSKPVAPLNVLKMRDATDTTVYPEGVPDGYKFSTYFGKHRPYMRCWDTGSECGSDTISPDLSSTTGANYALMGAGREEQSCTIGGDGDRDTRTPFMSATRSDKANPIADWMELKLYQANALRTLGLKCLPRHEETLKIGEGEHFILYKTGVEMPQQVEIPDASAPGGKITRTSQYVWPWGWRGYVSDPKPEWRFPNFGSGGSATMQAAGLDNAEPGDILVYDQDVVKNRNPYLALVSEANTLATNKNATPENTKISAYSINHGKFPDACGNTDRLFMGSRLEMYKTTLPGDFQAMLDTLQASAPVKNNTCDDPALSNCVENNWAKVKRYRISEDKR